MRAAGFFPVSRSEDGYIAANALVGSNRMQIFVNGNEEQALLTACFDNLGKALPAPPYRI